MDIEGHEKEVFKNTQIKAWENVDIIVEVQDENSAKIIFDTFKDSNMNLFSEKTSWSKVQHFTDMPISYHEGSLFITGKHEMNWSVEQE